MSSNESHKQSLRIAILGTRGIPANYGGFETFAQELSTRLAKRGHGVTVYTRPNSVDPTLTTFHGVELVSLPCYAHKYLETISHTAICALHAVFQNYDAIILCNAANAFLSWIPQVAGQKVILNVDGIERLRRKWNLAGRLFYRLGEFLATELPSAAVSDAKAIQRYYLEEYGASTRFIAYGAPTGRVTTTGALDRLGLEEFKYILYVSRLEPENNAALVIDAYRQSSVEIPLVLVGDAPYGADYIRSLRAMAQGLNVVLPGAIYGLGYRELLSYSRLYIQATEVGGTHPALIEAMGAGCLVLANDTPENREVVGDAGFLYPFNSCEEMARLMREASSRGVEGDHFRSAALERVRLEYNWGSVVQEYEDLIYELVSPAGA